jgi:hypothetical protein
MAALHSPGLVELLSNKLPGELAMEPLIFFILLFLLIGLCFDCAPQNQPDQDAILRRSR